MNIIETDFWLFLSLTHAKYFVHRKNLQGHRLQATGNGCWNLKRLLSVTEGESIRGDPQPPTIRSLLDILTMMSLARHWASRSHCSMQWSNAVGYNGKILALIGCRDS